MVTNQPGKFKIKRINLGQFNLQTYSSIIRHRHKSTSDCHRDRPLLMHHIHLQHTRHQITQFWFNNIIQCHHHKDPSQNYLTALHLSCHHHHSRTQQCSTRPPNPSINQTTSRRYVRKSYRLAVGRVGRTRSAERCMGWITATRGALSANGKRRVAVLVTENY